MSEDAFFLNSDDAKSLGNLDNMRQPLKVKKSFPKIAGGKPVNIPAVAPKAAMETVQNIGAESSPSAPTADTTATRRRPDSNLEMFRRMARDLK